MFKLFVLAALAASFAASAQTDMRPSRATDAEKIADALRAGPEFITRRLSDAPPHAHSLCDPLLKPKRSDRNSKLANDQDRLIKIQIP